MRSLTGIANALQKVLKGLPIIESYIQTTAISPQDYTDSDNL